MPDSSSVATTPNNVKSIAVMVMASPHHSSSAQTALDFCQSVIQQGYSIYRLFFYHEAAYLANNLTNTPQDENNLAENWQSFILEYKLDAVVCIASGLKRGMLDSIEAKRYEEAHFNLSPAMQLSGLGQWVDAVNHADQHIIFG